MILTGAWLTRTETQSLLALIEGAGHQALLVGGCVRNALIGAPVGDIDVATDALPETVIALAKSAGLRTIPTGLDHGTVTVLSGDIAHEVTTFRRDLQTDGRHAVVSFTASLQQDAARRDFTMNALYARVDGTVIDPLGGLPDLLARRVRFVGDPAARITEDALRILRFFRFHAWYGDPAQGLDADGLAACAALSACTDPLSRERIGAEMQKLLTAPDPAPAVAAMAATGILARILPGATPDALAPLIHLEQGTEPDYLRRLAALGGENPTGPLRLSRAYSRDWEQLRGLMGGRESPAELGYRHGPARAKDTLLLRGALFSQPLPPGWEQAVTLGSQARFPLQGTDLMPAFQGPALGKHLAELEQRWIASNFSLNRAALLA